MKDLNKYIKEGFFSNVGATHVDPEKWFSQIAISATDQYLTKYDTKNCKRDNRNWKITFLNNYKKDNKERELTLDLKPYMLDLFETYDPTKILVELGTGLYQHHKFDALKFKHKERIEIADEKGTYFDSSKIIKVTVTLMPDSNPRPELSMINGTMVNKMLQYTNHTLGYGTSLAQHTKNQNKKRKLLLKFAGYLNDYPFDKDNFIEIENNLKD